MVTSGHKTLGAKWLTEPRFSHQRSLYPDSEVAPKPPTILYRQPFGGKAEKTEKSERKFYIMTNFADNKIKENL